MKWNVDTYDENGNLVESKEVDLPDPPAEEAAAPPGITPEAAADLVAEMKSVSTQSAKINVLMRFFENIAEQ